MKQNDHLPAPFIPVMNTMPIHVQEFGCRVGVLGFQPMLINVGVAGTQQQTHAKYQENIFLCHKGYPKQI